MDFDFVICGFGRKKDPKEQFREWRRQMRQQVRLQDRQIRKMHNEQRKVKQSIKQAAKRGDMESARLLAREVVRADRAVARCHTAKAHMNSVVLQCQQRIAMREVLGAMQKSAEMTASMNRLVSAFEVREVMLAMSNEMIKAGIIEEMTDDAMEALDAPEDEEAAEEELDKVLVELNIAATGGMASAPTGQVAATSAGKGDKGAAAGLLAQLGVG